MLDLDEPITQYRFEAAALQDAVKSCIKRMLFATTECRGLIMEDCQAILNRLRMLNRDHFEAAPYIFTAIDELENAFRDLAAIEVDEGTISRAKTVGSCPVCATILARIELNYMPNPEDRLIIYCRQCEEAVSLCLEKLDSSEGFGTWAI